MKINDLLEAKIINFKDVKVWVSPSKSDLLSLLAKFHELRGMVTSHNIYVWNAFDAKHGDINWRIEKYEDATYDDGWQDDVPIYISDTKNIGSSEWEDTMKQYGPNLFMTGHGLPYAYSLNPRFDRLFPEHKQLSAK